MNTANWAEAPYDILAFNADGMLVEGYVGEIGFYRGTDENDEEKVKVPEKPGVYNFFAELTWKNGDKETVFLK